jgi:hypothetical protein
MVVSLAARAQSKNLRVFCVTEPQATLCAGLIAPLDHFLFFLLSRHEMAEPIALRPCIFAPHCLRLGSWSIENY